MTDSDYDVIIAGASLAGCTTAVLLARAGARVALIERRPDPQAFKRICTHFIQNSAVPTLERLDLLSPILAAGGVRSSARFWTRWGMIEPPPAEDVPPGVNIRREKLDPLIRDAAASTPGVELMLGETVCGVVHEGEAVNGLEIRDRRGQVRRLRAKLVVGADGRQSTVAGLAQLPRREYPHGRFGYGAYYEGPSPAGAPDGTLWFLDPNWAAAFPTDDGLTFYGCMPTKDRLPEFRRDRVAALEGFMAALPDAPPIRDGHRVSEVIGKVELTNVHRGPVGPGIALVGDAAVATDPLFGVGCGWALQSGEWLADSVAPAVRGEEPMEAGLRRYKRLHGRRLVTHARLIDDYATGRRFNLGERITFSAAAYDPKVAVDFARFGTRMVGPQILGKVMARSLWVHARRRVNAARGGSDGRGMFSGTEQSNVPQPS